MLRECTALMAPWSPLSATSTASNLPCAQGSCQVGGRGQHGSGDGGRKERMGSYRTYITLVAQILAHSKSPVNLSYS